MSANALKLADADGPEAKTIRKLAQHLGVTPMALYWHFRARKDLLAGVAEQSEARSTSTSTRMRRGGPSSNGYWNPW